MAPAAPPLPTRFPCWCRAVYSWGGESKRDLGFIEGDLIECLNAGDGSWWVGRLYRDRRTVGSFPSNFVELLPSQFRPTTKSVPAPVPNAPPSTAPTKSRTFRKPFEAYAKAPHYTSAKQPEIFKETPKPKERQNSGASFAPSTHETERGPSPAPPQSYNHRGPSPAPPQAHDHRAPSPAPSPAPSHHYGSRAPSPAPMHSYHSRAPSPAPMHSYHHSRAPSPAPPHGYDARGPSPAPPMHQSYGYASRGPSPAPSFHRQIVPYRGGQDRGNSPPPPPPPPHRQMTRGGSNDLHRRSIDISRHGSNASFHPFSPSRQNSNNSYRPPQPPQPTIRHGSRGSFDDRSYMPYTPGRNSPVPPSPAGGMTPSPLREAMDGVMEQLDVLGGGLGRPGQAPSPEPPADPWSPESFDMLSHRSNRRDQERSRPKTSMGIAQDEGYETYSGESSQEVSYQSGGREDKLSSYVDRMEKRFQQMHRQNSRTSEPDDDQPPPPPPKNVPYERPKSSMGRSIEPERKLRARKSAYEIGRGVARTLTTKTNSTNSSSGNQSNTSSSTQSTSRTLWSGTSAGAFSTTSAGSLARSGKRQRAQSALGARDLEIDRPDSPFTGVTYHSSHASDSPAQQRPQTQVGFHDDPSLELGGLVQPKPPKRNIFRKIFDTAKTGVASSRGGLVAGGLGMDSPKSPFARSMPAGASPMPGMGSTPTNRDVATEMGLSGGVDWVQVRRDVNRSNSLSTIELTERRERCQMMDHPALNPVDELYEGVEGDEGTDGEPVQEPTNYQGINLSQVDKNSRFISGLPPAITATQLATTYVCRPYRSDVQRLRAIFTWVSEKICWEEDFEGEIDTTRVIQAKRACAEEYAVLVMEMCSAIGIHCEIVRGYLKSPGEVSEINIMPRPNHWWNAVLVDNEWRMIDCCLASPSYPRRGLYSNANNIADPWWFLTRPLEICWTHIPEHHSQQHIVPPVAHETLLNLPCACAPFFRNGFEMVDYNTALTRIEDLEMVHIKFSVPCDVEIAAEVEVRGYSRDSDGDVFESGDIVKKRTLAQAEWFNGIKRYTVKALLPGDEGQGTLKIYAGKRGLMHSIKDIPHPLAFALPIVHTGENPPYEFVTRHPTPHAQRHDIYVVQPQCQRLALNNTFVFAIRQHPSSLGGSALTPSSNPGGTSPIPFARPSSALSMNASSVSGSTPSSATGTVAGKKPAKLAIQTPGGKILRLMRKEDRKGIHVGGRSLSGSETASDGGTWETIIKCSEKGVWRGLVLADRTARWCVFAEWPSPQPAPKQVASPARPQARQIKQNQQPRQDASKQQQETIRQPAQKPTIIDVDEPASETVAQQEPEQMVYVNLQDIQKLPLLPPVTMDQTQGGPTSHTGKTTNWDAQYESGTVKPMDIMLSSPQTQPLPPPQPKVQASHHQPAQAQPQMATPRAKPSPLSSVVNSPAINAHSPSITKKSPASTPKSRPLDTVHLMVAVAEECFDKARGSVHDVAMSLNATRIDEYQKLISTGLACLEACLQSNRLSPRQEAKMRLRYATVVLEETENPMEAETAVTKGISLCEKNGLADLKYCMDYIRLKLLFQRNHKAALNAADRQIADCETYKHIQWVYAFRLLKASFYMELGQTADASALENIRSIQVTASSRGDDALSVFAFILEGLALLKASKDGNIEKVQACIAQVAKYQCEPTIHIMQLDILTLLLDLVCTINHSGLDLMLDKLKMLQDRMDACTDWHSVKSDFLIPVQKQPATGHTISSDTAGIIRSGEGVPEDFLVMSFMTKVELNSLIFTLTGLVNMHKSSAHGRQTADFLNEGVRALETWDKATAGFRYGPSISLQDAIAQREWRLEAHCYLTILLGLYAASHCQWDLVKQYIVKLQDIMIPSTQGILRLLAIYLSGVFDQGTGELDAAMNTFQKPDFDLNQRGTGVKAAHRELAMLAGLNRLWIMQHPSYRNDRATLDLIEELRPLCLNHHNVDLRTAWHNVMAAISTDPPQQLNQQKQHIQSAMAGSKSTKNVLGAAVTLAIMRSRLFENVVGDQALKSALAAAKQAHRSGNVLWQSVADGMLAHSYEVQGKEEEAAQEWARATREAQEAFAGSF
ncbi:Transglutaminase-like [Fusarium oxysporum f. sp. vasinfectum]|nr:Transglutaminase-like [Fusarium oxysporum f. sp. vasinfectum]